MLTLAQIQGGYGESRVLFDVSLTVGEGEMVALLGRNGMGKTTTVRTIMGLERLQGGAITWDGVSLAGQAPHRIARLGLGLVPEGRHVFPTLSVAENLIATSRPGEWTQDAVYGLFPRLAERRRHLGRQLSGGEQQMLAIGRALMTNPRLLILDEATEGLAPLIRAEIWQCLERLKSSGMSILVIDKYLDALLRLADHCVILEKGRTVWHGTAQEMAASPEISEAYLHV
jgi:branched-chain amino acid transport system ATP-binding protein